VQPIIFTQYEIGNLLLGSFTFNNNNCQTQRPLRAEDLSRQEQSIINTIFCTLNNGLIIVLTA